MKDDLARQTAAQGDDDAIRALLAEMCDLTGMGFAAVVRVTEDRWIVAQVLDRIEFGLDPGDELAVMTTICNEIRQSGQMVVIDRVADDPAWRTHPTPILYGFQSYVSVPLCMADGSFYGTLCAIDPSPRILSAKETVMACEDCARRAVSILLARTMA